jgi:LPXTG-motif cell wall-anchored protein
VTDDTDHVWRQGLSVHVEVNPTADTSVQYPPAGAPCFDPPVVDQGGPTTTTTTTTVTGQGGPVPSLPRTGSNSTGMAVTIGAMLLLGGLVLLTAVRRPRRS